jgi:phage shock protein E
MRNRVIVLSLILLAALLAGCGAAAPVNQAAAPAAPAVDVAKLGDTVDVATVKGLLGNPDVVMLDVREPNEYQAGHIPGIKLLPVGEVANRLSEIPKDKPVIVTCHSGNRSGQVAKYLRDQGYTNIHNMQGGIVAWEAAGYPVEK